MNIPYHLPLAIKRLCKTGRESKKIYYSRIAFLLFAKRKNIIKGLTYLMFSIDTLLIIYFNKKRTNSTVCQGFKLKRQTNAELHCIVGALGRNFNTTTIIFYKVFIKPCKIFNKIKTIYTSCRVNKLYTKINS